MTRLPFTSAMAGVTWLAIWASSGRDAVVAEVGQAGLVETHGQGSGGAHDADAAVGHAEAAEFLGSGVHDVEDGERGGGAHLVVPAMGGVAGDGDGAAAACSMPRMARRNQGNGSSPPARAAVRSGMRGPTRGWRDMVLVPRGGGEEGEARHEMALASGPIPPSTPSILSTAMRTPCPVCPELCPAASCQCTG